ncbi:MAG: DUF3048 domain-containing protein [Lachnospiraceae bacterium]|nr:DUF3048 domain-containing protein [Lachnospiraceae bacterium]
MMAGCDTSIIAPVRDEESGLLGDALINEDVETTDVAIAEPETTDDTGVVVTTGEDGETVLKDEDGTPIVRSYLTGKLIKLNEQWTRPLAVMMNNIKEGCPQSGIESAAIVYEFPVEGRITRLMGIFENYNKIPDKIGSIRSSRDYFVYTALEYDAIYAHFGQATVYVGELLNSPSVDNISGAVSGIDNPATSTFYRSSDRKAPHNVYVSKEGLLSDVEKFGYRTTLRLDYQQKFTFPAKQGDRVTYADKPDALVLYPGGKRSGLANGFSNVSARFEYNPEDGKYYRFEYGGKHIDKETGNQLAYDNVIFQYCHGEVRDSHDYLAFGLHGDNGYKVQVFTNGKMVEGTWSRGTDTGYMPALYVDKDGKPITINEGKTWICMIWDEYSDDVVIE